MLDIMAPFPHHPPLGGDTKWERTYFIARLASFASPPPAIGLSSDLAPLSSADSPSSRQDLLIATDASSAHSFLIRKSAMLQKFKA